MSKFKTGAIDLYAPDIYGCMNETGRYFLHGGGIKSGRATMMHMEEVYKSMLEELERIEKKYFFTNQNNTMQKETQMKMIAEAIGHASMCWNPGPEGTFDSTKANEVAETLWIDLFAQENQLQREKAEHDANIMMAASNELTWLRSENREQRARLDMFDKMWQLFSYRPSSDNAMSSGNMDTAGSLKMRAEQLRSEISIPK